MYLMKKMKKNSETYLRKIAAFKQKLRFFLENKNYLEVQTPVVVDTPGAEVFLDFFSTTESFGSNQSKKWLQSSPEIEMKKILASSGIEKIYQICPVFRNSESPTPWHMPEFTMLEFYSKNHDFHKFMKECGQLIQGACALKKSITEFHIGKFLNEKFNLHLDQPENFLIEAKKRFSYTNHEDDLDSVFSKVLNFECESQFKDKELVVVTGYPSFQLTLAKENQGFSERFEYFVHGVEVANGFHELTGKENIERFAEIQNKRKKLGNHPLPINEKDIHVIASNETPSCGVAVGVDRLFALSEGQSSLYE